MKYYIILNDVQLGPLDEQELRRLPVTPQTPVWHEGMADWAPCGTVGELADMFAATPPSIHRAPAGYDPVAASFSSGGYRQGPTAAPGSSFEQIPECPQTYLGWSILVTMLCCLPFGVVAIIKSCGVTTSYNRGDYESALKNSKEAQTWIIVSVVVGLISGVLVTALQIFSALV